MGGSFRFLQRVWTLTQEFIAADGKSNKSTQNEELLQTTHRTIKKVSQDLLDLSFNTAIASLMECVNDLYKIKAEQGYNSTEWRPAIETLLQLLAPFAPHIAEELWQQLGHQESIHLSHWPSYDEKYLIQDTMTIVIQVNGKLRGEIHVASNTPEETVVSQAKAHERVTTYLSGQTIRKTIYVPGRLVNFVL